MVAQASDLKHQLERLALDPAATPIASIDAVDFYPSVKFKLVQQAVDYYSAGLSQEDRATIKHGLEMIQFGMRSTLLCFQDQYYEYDAAKNPTEKGLSIGSYESAWLADLAGAYILDNTEDCFTEAQFHGLYRDDGIAVFRGNKTPLQMAQWLELFQKKVNAIYSWRRLPSVHMLCVEATLK